MPSLCVFFSFFERTTCLDLLPLCFPSPSRLILNMLELEKKKRGKLWQGWIALEWLEWMSGRFFRRKRVRQAQRTHSFHATRDSFSFPFCSSEMTKTWVHLITSMCIKLTLPPQFCLHRIEFLAGRGDRWPFHLLSGEKKEGFSFFLASFRLFHHLGCN